MAKLPKPTRFENAIHKVLPGTALTMYQKRVSYMAATGAYTPTRKGDRPFDNYVQFLTSPNNRTNKYEHETLINFSRFLCMSSIGTAITNRLTDHAIGSGLTFRASINHEFLGINEDRAKQINKEFTRLWKTFFQGENGHYERMYSGGYFQANAFKSMLEGGDNFILPVRTRPRKNHRFPFALQSIEAERVSTPLGEEGNPDYYLGIQRNASRIPVRIHVAENTDKNIYQVDSAYDNPSEWSARDIFGSNTGIRQVFQLKNLAQDRPGALRGIPFLTPTTGLIIDHTELTNAVLKAAKIQSIFAAFWKGGTGAGKFGKAPGQLKTSQTSGKFPRIDLTAGQILDIPEGYEELKAFETTQPGKDFTPFQMHILSLIGAICGIPQSVIMMIFGKNFSASRGEMAIYWVTVMRNRVAFVQQFLFPFWEYLLSWAVASGNISAPGFFDDPEVKMAWLGDPVHQFSGPRMPQLDLEKEAKGMVAMRDGGFKSTRGLIEQSSEDDPDAVFDELEEEKERGIIDAVAKQNQQLIQENEQGQQGDSEEMEDE